MAAITISRGTFSGGKTIAEHLAKDLGYRCIDRDVIVEKAAAQGVSQQELHDALEKPPTFLERFGHKRYAYLVLMQAALVEEFQGGDVIYHGLAGHLLLGGGAPLLRVRIIAPLEFRIRKARDRLALSRADAVAYIEKADHDRRKWTQYLYGVDWGDPALYDIVLNLEHLRIEEAAGAIAVLARQRCFSFTGECKRRLRDLLVASRVRAALVLNPATSDLEVEVESRDGSVTVRGKLTDLGQVKDIEETTWKVPGVIGLNIDELATAART